MANNKKSNRTPTIEPRKRRKRPKTDASPGSLPNTPVAPETETQTLQPFQQSRDGVLWGDHASDVIADNAAAGHVSVRESIYNKVKGKAKQVMTTAAAAATAALPGKKRSYARSNEEPMINNPNKKQKSGERSPPVAAAAAAAVTNRQYINQEKMRKIKYYYT